MTIKEFKVLKWKHDCAKTSMPEWAVPTYNYKDNTANALTRLVCDFITLMGGQAERVNSMGRVIDGRKLVTNVLGQTGLIGSQKYIPGTSTKGTADISATIKGLSVKIEVKIGKDKQSQAQKDYQAMIEQAGGIYWIVKDWDGFYEKYCNQFK